MKKLVQSTVFSLFAIGFLLVGNTAKAQTYTTPTYNNVKFQVNSEGSFFLNTNSKPVFVIPATGTTSSIYAANLWLAADRPGASIVAACETYSGSGADFIAGPNATTYDAAYKARWNRVWSISKAVIMAHAYGYQASGYQVPEIIASWPAHGDTALGEPRNLAPFFDANADGNYSPELGDYPVIRGDYAVFYLRNDLGGQKTGTYSEPMNVQVSMMFYGYGAATEPINNTLFLHAELLNAGTVALENVKMGMWIDFDLGNASDDYIGTYVAENAIYVYNGQNNDQASASSAGYGETPPAQAFMFLNTELSGSVFYNRSGSPENTEPTSKQHYYNYLNGKNKLGAALPSQFAYSGNPDGSEGESEGSAGNWPGDRRMVAVANAGTLLPGQSVCRDGAFVWSRAAQGNQLASVEQMKTDLTTVRQLYNEKNEGDCSYAMGILKTPEKGTFNIYPNPAAEKITIAMSIGSQLNKLELVNALGQVLLTSKQTTLSLENISAGIYLVRLTNSAGETTTQRLVVE